jgi:hypothetical protein
MFRAPVVTVKPLDAVSNPVTPSVPPIVALFVTPNDSKVASPEVERVDNEELPVTARVPVIFVLPPIVASPVRF